MRKTEEGHIKAFLVVIHIFRDVKLLKSELYTDLSTLSTKISVEKRGKTGQLKLLKACPECDILSLIQKPMKGGLTMKFIIVGKNIEVTEGLKSAVEDKIGKLEKYFTEDTEVHVTLSVEKERQKIEVTIPVKGSIIRSEQVSSDMYISIDLVEEIIERQLKKYKTKLVDQKQNTAFFKQEYIDKDFMDEEEVKIIRTKKFDIKPMYPEDACVQMELLGHNFFVFCNAETDQVNVVYKRKGSTYGLIEPEV